MRIIYSLLVLMALLAGCRNESDNSGDSKDSSDTSAEIKFTVDSAAIAALNNAYLKMSPVIKCGDSLIAYLVKTREEIKVYSLQHFPSLEDRTMELTDAETPRRILADQKKVDTIYRMIYNYKQMIADWDSSASLQNAVAHAYGHNAFDNSLPVVTDYFRNIPTNAAMNLLYNVTARIKSVQNVFSVRMLDREADAEKKAKK